MGLHSSKPVDNADWSSYPAALTKKEPPPSSRSNYGACPSNHVFPRFSGPLLVDDYDFASIGTQSSRGSPESSCHGGDTVQRYPSSNNAPNRRRSWRDFSTSSKHAAIGINTAYCHNHRAEDTMSHPDKIYIVTRKGTEAVPCPKPMRQEESDTDDSAATRVSRSLEEDDSDRLQTLYDLRTWALYLRITEARKKQAANSSSQRIAHASFPANDNAHLDGFGQRQRHYESATVLETPSHDHSLIFGELE